jgi:hypothetical protein
MNKRYFFFAALVAGMLFLTGCESQQTGAPAPAQSVPNVPFSKGPDGPPAVKGPNMPPPETTVNTAKTLPQAVSETEKVKYSL